MPSNLGEYTTPIGIPETIEVGSDITLCTYGSCVRIARNAIRMLRAIGISVELIDVQSLIPFDINHDILSSLQKTNKIVFMDEDVPGGATAHMMQQVLEIQGGYEYLDAKPITITASENRGAFGSDGDYFCKPNAEDVFEAVYMMMHEEDPETFPEIF
ncbi:UNVERIFIED_CONTAM: hypothetical protein GTU68_036305 [Idotea baltica]|nr:hypothetical protein [Idotea baltica]